MTKIELDQHVIKFKGTFDFDKLFNEIYSWLDNRHYEINESKFKHKVPNAKGKEEEIGWKADRKITHNIKYWINLDFKFCDFKDVEIVEEGKKKKMSFARVIIKINGAVEHDYNNQFKSKFQKKLYKFFTQFIYKEDLGVIHADTMDYEVYRLHSLIKRNLGMTIDANAFEGR
jgi:hypothetical protein